jgi:hypothetical protein
MSIISGKRMIQLMLAAQLVWLVGCAGKETAPNRVNLLKEQPAIQIELGDEAFDARQYGEATRHYSRAEVLQEKADPKLNLRLVVAGFGSLMKSPAIPFGEAEFEKLVKRTRSRVDGLAKGDDVIAESYFIARMCREGNEMAGRISLPLVCDQKELMTLSKRINAVAHPDLSRLAKARIEIAGALEAMGEKAAARGLFQSTASPLTEREKAFYASWLKADSVAVQSRYAELIEYQQVTRGDVAFVLNRELGFLATLSWRQPEKGWKDTDHTYQQAMQWMGRLGLSFPEFKPGCFEPDKTVSRRELAMVFHDLMTIARRNGLNMAPVLEEGTAVSHWSDLTADAPSHPAMVAAVLYGLIASDGDRIHPLAAVSGKEMLAAIERFKKVIM